VEAYEIRALSDDEMRVRLHDVEEEFFNLRFRLSVGQLENHNRIRELKRDVARLKTILRERELEDEAA
jgi:large subunit ribosomal protein L29